MEHRVHTLKTWPVPFAAVRAGLKGYEIRLSDRDFRVGDFLQLSEYDPEDGAGFNGKHFTGNAELVLVTYMTPGGQWGLPSDVCVMSISLVPQPMASIVLMSPSRIDPDTNRRR